MKVEDFLLYSNTESYAMRFEKEHVQLPDGFFLQKGPFEISIFDPPLVKPKYVLGGFYQFSPVSLQFPKNSATPESQVGLYKL